MSAVAYAYAGVKFKSFKDTGCVQICCERHREFKVDVDQDWPEGLILTIDPTRPEYVIPYTGAVDQEPLTTLGCGICTNHHTCDEFHPICMAGQFRYEYVLWDVLSTYDQRRAIVNLLEQKGVLIYHEAA